jgi:hypothetical protein
VPAGFSDLFTMLNARDFLEDGVYVCSDCCSDLKLLFELWTSANDVISALHRYISNMQKKSEGCRKAQSFMITHEEDGHTYTFKVDTVARFRDKDWCVRFIMPPSTARVVTLCAWFVGDDSDRRSVVGVIVSGQSWQFKGWKWKFPLEVFKKGACTSWKQWWSSWSTLTASLDRHVHV